MVRNQTEFIQLARRLFQQASEMPPAEREAFLQQQCAGNPRLQTFLQRLLDADGQLSAQPGGEEADQLGRILRQMDSDELLGRRVGDFIVQRLLGRGGMGTVYLARHVDESLQQFVALKLLSSELHDDEAVRRFRFETRVLAKLRHPNIAQLHNAGIWDDGRPYYVMEYIQGNDLLRHCDKGRLDIGQRLALFTQVCGAIQLAHSSLIIHRDIKSSNILVDQHQQIKLLDFGIARPLPGTGENPELTKASGLFLSYLNAAPEQLRGQTVGTACDIYQLGVLLYELLSGCQPYQVEDCSNSEIEQQILNRMPRPMEQAVVAGEADLPARRGCHSGKQLQRQLKGDLDAIVAKCLRKEPEQRYSAVTGLQTDLQRWDQQEPVHARKGSRRYYWGKFVRRNRSGIAALSAIVLLTLAFALAMWQQSIKLATERDRAEAERIAATAQQQRAETVSGFLVNAFEAADPTRTQGERITAADILTQSANQLSQSAPLAADIRADLLTTVAQVQINLGLYQAASDNAAGSAAVHAGLQNAAGQALALLLQADAQQALGNNQNSLVLLDQVEQLLGDEALKQGRVLVVRGQALANLDRRDEALESFQQAVDLSTGKERVLALEKLAAAYAARRGFEQALAYYQQAIELELSESPRQHRLGMIELQLANILRRQSRYDVAVASAERARATLSAIYPDNHYLMAGVYNSLANAYLRAQRYQEAGDAYAQSLSILESTVGSEHPRYAMTLNNLAAARRKGGDLNQAVEYYAEAIRVGRKAWPAGHRNIGFFSLGQALALAESGSYQQADEALDRATEIFSAYPKQYPLDQARIDAERAYLRNLQGHSEEARALLKPALSIMRSELGENDSSLRRLQALAEALD